MIFAPARGPLIPTRLRGVDLLNQYICARAAQNPEGRLTHALRPAKARAARAIGLCMCRLNKTKSDKADPQSTNLFAFLACFSALLFTL